MNSLTIQVTILYHLFDLFMACIRIISDKLY